MCEGRGKGKKHFHSLLIELTWSSGWLTEDTCALETSIPKILRGYLRPEEAAMHSKQLYSSLAKSSTLTSSTSLPCFYRRAIQPASHQLLADDEQKKGTKREVSGLCQGCPGRKKCKYHMSDLPLCLATCLASVEFELFIVKEGSAPFSVLHHPPDLIPQW